MQYSIFYAYPLLFILYQMVINGETVNNTLDELLRIRHVKDVYTLRRTATTPIFSLRSADETKYIRNKKLN